MTQPIETSRPSNRLALESSPYLLQHQHNPVDWYPWGEEALKKAKDEDKPIFLSIGYSACHWCHVMEHESFEDIGIASVLNANFVNIKVDREERPDLDQIYMNAMMALKGGGGGWPLSVFLTPDQEVFFGGTYWPPKSRMGMPGFDHVLHSVLDAFSSKRDQVNEQSRKITAWLNEKEARSTEEPSRELLVSAAKSLAKHFDYIHGGFGEAPKFPHAMDLRLLVLMSRTCTEYAEPGREAMLEMVRLNCKKMAYGGIFDHLGGGFARYSVDEKWLVPHFEKMLYDNALLADVYLEMFEATNDVFYKMIATKTLDYLLEYLTDKNHGGFYCTEDADSEGEEGKFYVWSKQEVLGLLGEENGALFCELYNVTDSGNFEGSNILNMTRSYQEFADAKGIEKSELRSRMKTSRASLLSARDQRIRPGLDDKILTSWNGLAIRAMAKAGVLINAKYGQAAAKAARFLLDELRDDRGRLLHTWRHGKAKLGAYLDDYAYLINALVELYQFDHDEIWIERAVELAEQMVQYFSDKNGSAFYFTASDHESLIARTKSFQDSSVPSGNSMAATALLRLGRITGRLEWSELAFETMKAAMPLMKRSPLASGQMLIAVQQWLDPAQQLVLVAPKDEQIEGVVEAFQQRWDPSSFLLVRTPSKYASAALEKMFLGKPVREDAATLYVCEGMACSPPVIGRESILNWLEEN